MHRIDRGLIRASTENNLPEVSRLLSVGANVNAKDNEGWTPLHWACRKGHVQVAKEILEHGADITVKDNAGRTPLHWACYNGHVTVGNELLSRGANIEAETGDW
jgi:ankyrin repeat protein